jgi:hypothetical protein
MGIIGLSIATSFHAKVAAVGLGYAERHPSVAPELTLLPAVPPLLMWATVVCAVYFNRDFVRWMSHIHEPCDSPIL